MSVAMEGHPPVTAALLSPVWHPASWGQGPHSLCAQIGRQLWWEEDNSQLRAGWQNLRAYCMCADPWKTNGSPRRLKKQRSTSKLTAQNDELTVSALTQWPYCYCVCLSWNKRWTINKAFLCFTAQKRNQNQNQRYHVLIYLTCNYSVYITHKASWYKGTTFLQYVSYQFQIPCLWADCHVKRWRGESWRETPVTESVSPFANGTTWYLWGVILQLYLWRRNQVCQNMFFS